MITLGGDAELELVDTLDPFSEGIVFSVRPPKKSWKNISNLSGGEKTLSSLALVSLELNRIFRLTTSGVGSFLNLLRIKGFNVTIWTKNCRMRILLSGRIAQPS